MPSWHASAECTNLNDASVVADCLLPVVEERIVAEHAEPFMPGIRVAREIEYLYAAASRDAGDYSLSYFVERRFRRIGFHRAGERLTARRPKSLILSSLDQDWNLHGCSRRHLTVRRLLDRSSKVQDVVDGAGCCFMAAACGRRRPCRRRRTAERVRQGDLHARLFLAVPVETDDEAAVAVEQVTARAAPAADAVEMADAAGPGQIGDDPPVSGPMVFASGWINGSPAYAWHHSPHDMRRTSAYSPQAAYAACTGGVRRRCRLETRFRGP